MSLFTAMTGHPVAVGECDPITAGEFARVLARRDLAFRNRIVQMMLLCALILRPLPADVAARIAEFARELGVDEGMVEVARRFADGALGLAAVDFDRNGYTAEWHEDDSALLHATRRLHAAWDVEVNDPQLAAQWES